MLAPTFFVKFYPPEYKTGHFYQKYAFSSYSMGKQVQAYESRNFQQNCTFFISEAS